MSSHLIAQATAFLTEKYRLWNPILVKFIRRFLTFQDTTK